MPIYEYHCKSCGADLEIFQHMEDPTLTVCPQCNGKLKKVFSPVGIVFKGSGFYATDSKKSTSSTSTSAAPASPTSPTSPAAAETPAPTAAKPASPGSSGTPASSTSTPASGTTSPAPASS